MKVLFDAYWWADGPPSGRNVVRSIVKSWSHEFRADDLTIAVPAKYAEQTREELALEDVSNVDVLGTRVPLHAGLSLVPRPGFDALVAQNFASQLPGRKTLNAVFVHDFIFLDHPEWFTRRERAYLAPMRAMATRADLVFTSSLAEKARIERYVGATRTVAVGLASPLLVDPPSPESPQESFDDPFILAVGRLNVRKNLDRLIGALDSFGVLNSHRLVVVGERDGAASTTEWRSKNVSWLGYVSDGELVRLYKNASLFVFPSLDEGFGLPLVEAMNAGCVIAASDIPAFRELTDEATFFDPNDEESIARGVQAALASSRHASPQRWGWKDTVAVMRKEIESA
ncbi:glycosyltransferase family 4 protein [Microbacterium hominis]|uniref:Glycosyltransferase family 4 protein n=1 Tax=Microbacterium hominis TaxID=162426 RepID=A0A7D4THP1_9MICO|nr:glycosyltransferase family 1 protein [Microbacterium hominis]QKJ20241.1 glycosyltransferase family 4 protein [Microbacterium hominis]